MKFKLALVCSLSLAAANAMACYTVYDRTNHVVYNAQSAPVDMTRPIHETLPAVVPGGHMVFALGSECPREAPMPRISAQAATNGTVLLTDRRTAEALHVPHTMISTKVALVTRGRATVTPGVVVAHDAASPPASVIAAGRSSTALMGAGPAP